MLAISIHKSCQIMALSVLVLMPCCNTLINGQTEALFNSKYKCIAAYEIRPQIFAYPTFSDNGQICKVIIAKSPLSDSQNVADAVISNDTAHQIVDEIVPASERGIASKYLSPKSYIAGGSSYIEQDYENVFVGMYGHSMNNKYEGVDLIVIGWNSRICKN